MSSFTHLLLCDKIQLYSSQIEKSAKTVQSNIEALSKIIRAHNYNTIYFAGIGKSYHIIKKCVATWQSLQINTHLLLVQDLFHGDMGIIRENDIIIYVSNSGNTTELVEAAKYIKENYKVTQISITNNITCKINDFVDYSTYVCDFKIQEADNYKIVPSVSSAVFLMFIDLLGITLSEEQNLSIEEFVKSHPVGIGKSFCSIKEN
jgi:arabinose-5-phosphate isomerase